MIIYSKEKLLEELKSCYDAYCSHPEYDYCYVLWDEDDPIWIKIDILKWYSFKDCIEDFCLAIKHMKDTNSCFIDLRCCYSQDNEGWDMEDKEMEPYTYKNEIWERWEFSSIFPFVQMICKDNNWNDIL